jgi:predicted esterase
MSESLIQQPEYSTGAVVIAYHGKSDNVVSIGGAKQAIALLQSQNVEVDFNTFDGGHHGVFTNMKAEINRKLEQLIISNK